jgi:L-fucose/D-arabinose isomerase
VQIAGERSTRHSVLGYDDLDGGLNRLASLLPGPADVYNVPSERVFRPSVWSRFGALEPQAADYRACATFGPLYR